MKIQYLVLYFVLSWDFVCRKIREICRQQMASDSTGRQVQAHQNRRTGGPNRDLLWQLTSTAHSPESRHLEANQCHPGSLQSLKFRHLPFQVATNKLMTKS